MLAPERRELILQEVLKNKSVLVKDLCEKFQVTGETIRKDLTLLEKDGKLLKTHGGAYIHEGASNEIHSFIRQGIFNHEKKAIARECAALVPGGATVFLDESTTAGHIAEELREKSSLTIITNSLLVMNALSGKEHLRVILIGGSFHHHNQSFYGSEAVKMISDFNADYAFVSCRGLDREKGITDGNIEGGEIRRRMLKQASRRILAVDYTKFDHAHIFCIDRYQDVDLMVVDKLPGSWSDFLAAKNIRVIEALREDSI